MWDVIIVISWESIKSPNPPAHIIIFFSAYMLATFVLGTEYMGCFTSFMVGSPYVEPPIETVEQLWNHTNRMWLGGRMSEYYIDYFGHIENVVDREFHMKIKNSTQEIQTAIEKLVDQPGDFVYFERKAVVEWNVCQYDIRLKGRNLYFSQETVGDYMTYVYFPKGFPYTEKFNRKILLLHDLGFVSYNHKKNIQTCNPEVERMMDMITLIHFKSGFYFTAIGYAVALVSLIVEAFIKIWHELQRAYRFYQQRIKTHQT